MDDLIDYLIAVMPLAAAHVLIPPLSMFEMVHDAPPEELQVILRSIYRIAPSFVFDRNFVFSLLLDSKNAGKPHWTMLSHIFVHRNYSHLIGNLSWTLMLGYPVFQNYGSIPMYLTYLIGGAFASVPMEKVTSLLKPCKSASPTNGNIWSFAGELLKPATTYIKKVTDALGLSWKELSCGSSGAVSAWLGCSCTFLIRDLCREVRMLVDSRRQKDSNHNKFLMFSVLFKCWQLYSMAEFIQTEIIAMNDWKTERSGWMSWLAPRESINHEAHLQGFGFGVVVSMIRILVK